ncbi:Oxidoreductase molybdopterin binding domain-containing protein [Chitinophaga sp. CF118]|uniref:molybdopterin-dependent oxidoreductase n=1 Tax=Chitinophaga sp. CF118 TaxID=1884367 RepID=UPI0008F0E7B0|nr:molybdopterin-dependent oxidoreductase [Chitinophaga sp. CF118]SFD02440.1 Oxidoreductase molybdopterin binding domain-containing protein [Chitinophaga sp. CF118]
MKLFFLLTLFICFTFSTLQAQSFIKVSGEVKRQLQLYPTDFAKMKRVTVSANDHDGKAHTYTGIAISEILDSAGATTGAQLRGKNLAKYMLVKCADGYKVVFSLAELDNNFTDRIVILSDMMDGKPLPEGKGPYKLVVPGEKKPARSCLQVTELVIGVAGE